MLQRKIWRRKRATQRAAAKLSIRIFAARRAIPALTGDISRTGARLHIRAIDVGVDCSAGLFDMGKAVSAVLGDGFDVELAAPKGPALVRKTMTAVRIGTIRRATGEIEVGSGKFVEPMSEAEATQLGLRLPSDPPSENWPS